MYQKYDYNLDVLDLEFIKTIGIILIIIIIVPTRFELNSNMKEDKSKS